ncbi:MAG: hypothetical protein K2Q14_03975, partial [Gammaproteobacteria bacterium]|nr:hypothetical protein [Gammaproteobacteria bacterium]
LKMALLSSYFNLDPVSPAVSDFALETFSSAAFARDDAFVSCLSVHLMGQPLYLWSEACKRADVSP